MHSLRPQQIAYILPGEGYKQADLETIFAAAQAACSDEKLMELAWEVCAPKLLVNCALDTSSLGHQSVGQLIIFLSAFKAYLPLAFKE